jgi:RNA polymerase sigma-70 factor (ECF subfamily)
LLTPSKRWDTIGGYDDPGAWVRRVVANRAVSRWRRLGAEARALSRLGARRAEPLPDLDPPDDEFWAAVRDLPTRQAQAVALHYLDDLSTVDIARVLDIAEPTVRVHLFRGRRALAGALGLGAVSPTTEVVDAPPARTDADPENDR